MTKNMGSKRKEKMKEIASTEDQVDHGSLFSESRRKLICYDSDSNSHHHAKKKNKNQNYSNGTKSCDEVITNPLLLEDLRFHIFTFVPINCLLNSIRYVCKSWAETIGSSRFIEAYESRRRGSAHSSKIGLYVENRTLGPSYFLEFKDYVSGQFERTNLGTPERMGRIIGTCDGMLLLENYSCKQMFLVNPLLKWWLRLPFYPITERPPIFRYQGAITRVPRTGKFKLFLADCIEVLGVFWYVLYVLRIGKDNNTWKEIFRKEADLEQHFKCQIFYSSGGGDLYWITKKVVFLIDVDKEVIVPKCQLSHGLLNHRYLLMGGDRISCIDEFDNEFGTTFQIYILNFDSGKLSLYHEMGPFDFVAICGCKVYSSLIFRLWINDQIIFQVYVLPNEKISSNYEKVNYQKMHFGYNMETGQLTKIGDIDMGDFEVWLYTKTLITLPHTII
ncbi:unnamed protein product [Trifolium pratense]|uniref:Uncharacterized protein n=1 Tax=Trifolium pratense TaxID=57577 RepID=A0ACB0J0W5_TRIPR|nr:unnamed protein product [Trifolium pratense]